MDSKNFSCFKINTFKPMAWAFVLVFFFTALISPHASADELLVPTKRYYQKTGYSFYVTGLNPDKGLALLDNTLESGTRVFFAWNPYHHQDINISPFQYILEMFVLAPYKSPEKRQEYFETFLYQAKDLEGQIRIEYPEKEKVISKEGTLYQLISTSPYDTIVLLDLLIESFIAGNELKLPEGQRIFSNVTPQLEEDIKRIRLGLGIQDDFLIRKVLVTKYVSSFRLLLDNILNEGDHLLRWDSNKYDFDRRIFAKNIRKALDYYTSYVRFQIGAQGELLNGYTRYIQQKLGPDFSLLDVLYLPQSFGGLSPKNFIPIGFSDLLAVLSRNQAYLTKYPELLKQALDIQNKTEKIDRFFTYQDPHRYIPEGMEDFRYQNHSIGELKIEQFIRVFKWIGGAFIVETNLLVWTSFLDTPSLYVAQLVNQDSLAIGKSILAIGTLFTLAILDEIYHQTAVRKATAQRQALYERALKKVGLTKAYFQQFETSVIEAIKGFAERKAYSQESQNKEGFYPPSRRNEYGRESVNIYLGKPPQVIPYSPLLDGPVGLCSQLFKFH